MRYGVSVCKAYTWKYFQKTLLASVNMQMMFLLFPKCFSLFFQNNLQLCLQTTVCKQISVPPSRLQKGENNASCHPFQMSTKKQSSSPSVCKHCCLRSNLARGIMYNFCGLKGDSFWIFCTSRAYYGQREKNFSTNVLTDVSENPCYWY